MNRAEALAAADALNVVLATMRFKRVERLVVADHDDVLAKLVELAETMGEVIRSASTQAAETMASDAKLLAELSEQFGVAQRRASGAAAELSAARTVVRGEVLAHRDDKPARGSERSPWVASRSGKLLLTPLTNAIASASAVARPAGGGDACDLSAHYWLGGGIARMIAVLWCICCAEEALLSSAYTGVREPGPGERAQEAARRAGGEWREAGLAFIEIVAILKRRARQGRAVARPRLTTPARRGGP